MFYRSRLSRLWAKPEPLKFVSWLVVLLLLAACQETASSAAPLGPASPTLAGPVDNPSPLTSPAPVAAPSPTAPAEPPRGGTAILGLVGQPPGQLNPVAEANPALQELVPLLFDSLLQVDPDTAELQPGLARSWRYAQEGRQVIFSLPAGLKWSDGAPLTAADLVESLQASQHPALLAFSEITAPDDRTLALTFVKIDCSAVTALARLPLLPATQILAPLPQGSGPFRVEAWSENKRTLTLVRNPYYHGAPALLDGLTIRFIAESEIRVALSEGQFDAVGPYLALTHHPDSAGAIPVGAEPAGFTRLTYPAAQVIYLAINYAPKNEAPLEAAVRQALLQALDRPAILAELLADDGQLIAGPLLPGHWAAAEELAWPAYDPQAAQARLSRAGLRDTDGDGWLDRNGQRLELAIRVHGANPLQQQLAWLVNSYYRDLDLFARAEGVPFDSLVDDLFTHDFNLAVFSWPLLADPDQRLYWQSGENTEGSGLNFTSYANPRLDTLLDRAVAVPGCDPEARAEIYDQVQQILVRDRPVDFLLNPNRHLLVAGRLRGLHAGPFAPFTWNGAGWYVQEP